MSTFVNHSLGGFVEDGDAYVVTSDKQLMVHGPRRHMYCSKYPLSRRAIGQHIT